MIYFIADLHFHHKNIIKMKDRKFSDMEDMNKKLIKNWNKVVGVEDDVYVLGDLSFKGAEKTTDILLELNGRIHLILGNHDKFYKQNEFDKSLLEEVTNYKILEYRNRYFVLFHYPIEEWDGYYRGAYHLHGHQHNEKQYNVNNKEKGFKRYDVGVDANDMKPVSIEEIIHFFECE
ncbi:metallophosphoesterase [Tannockella kyphosi]|uniref:metallophosphoesterase n=1 Tax=Tannockella kyphosi TaxID=2899121 RepID=UPI002013BA29|nr:metallophosphoesterase [Tannockella kyphosi]